jgi:hypothetical protein
LIDGARMEVVSFFLPVWPRVHNGPVPGCSMGALSLSSITQEKFSPMLHRNDVIRAIPKDAR